MNGSALVEVFAPNGGLGTVRAKAAERLKDCRGGGCNVLIAESRDTEGQAKRRSLLPGRTSPESFGSAIHLGTAD